MRFPAGATLLSVIWILIRHDLCVQAVAEFLPSRHRKNLRTTLDAFLAVALLRYIPYRNQRVAVVGFFHVERRLDRHRHLVRRQSD